MRSLGLAPAAHRTLLSSLRGLILLVVVIKAIRGGKKASAEVWENPEGLEWTVPSPAPYHTFATAPEVK